MKDFIEYLVKSFVSKPDEVKIELIEGKMSEVEEEGDGKYLTVRLSVADDDMGKVIGKQGKTISALRRLLRLRNISTQEYQSVNLELEDNGGDKNNKTEVDSSEGNPEANLD